MKLKLSNLHINQTEIKRRIDFLHSKNQTVIDLLLFIQLLNQQNWENLYYLVLDNFNNSNLFNRHKTLISSLFDYEKNELSKIKYHIAEYGIGKLSSDMYMVIKPDIDINIFSQQEQQYYQQLQAIREDYFI